MECVNGKLSGNSILISITRIPINSKFIVFRGKYILLYNIKCKKQLSKQVIKKHKKKWSKRKGHITSSCSFLIILSFFALLFFQDFLILLYQFAYLLVSEAVGSLSLYQEYHYKDRQNILHW